MKRNLFFIAFFFLILGTAWAQDATFYAQGPRQVNLGQRFYLTFTVNQEGTGFISPEIQHFDVLSGPTVQTNTQYQSVNGKVSQSMSFSYTFVLMATEAGNFTIPPATITVKGKKISSNTITISVYNPGSSQQKSAGQSTPKGNQNSAQQDAIGNDIFLKAVSNKSNPYIGEEIIITYKLYTTTTELSINNPEKVPSYPGFWSQNQNLLKGLDRFPQYKETVNGKTYVVAEIRKEALFPQKTGSLTIAPLEQSVVYRVKVKGRSAIADDPFFNDPFFRNFFDDSNFGIGYQNVEKSLKSNPITVQVKPLPQQNKPVDFTGAVGQFTFKPSLDRSELKANEAMTLKLMVSGSGNLNLIDKPNITFPPDFEVYDPKIVDNIKSSISGVSGSRTFEYLIIPRTAGDFRIAPVQFAYFDLSKKDFVTLLSPEYNIKVNKGDGNAGSDLTTIKQDVKYIGNDIHYLMDTPLMLNPVGRHFFGGNIFWMLFAFPILLFILFLVIWRNHLRLNSDSSLVRLRKATRVATQRLKKAKSLLSPSTQEAFHIEISLALWGYISDKFNIPLAELSMETASESLSRRNVDPALISRFIETLQHCEFARFAPGDKGKNMENLYKEAIEVISNTEEQLK